MRIKTQAGFTLIEIMIVVTIIGILAGIAYPNYQEHVRNSRRTAAMGCVMEQAQFMERLYSATMTYVGANPAACPGAVTQFYNVAIGSRTATTYTITATPAGAQVGDRCGNLTINQNGVRGAGAADCWR